MIVDVYGCIVLFEHSDFDRAVSVQMIDERFSLRACRSRNNRSTQYPSWTRRQCLTPCKERRHLKTDEFQRMRLSDERVLLTKADHQ